MAASGAFTSSSSSSSASGTGAGSVPQGSYALRAVLIEAATSMPAVVVQGKGPSYCRTLADRLKNFASGTEIRTTNRWEVRSFDKSHPADAVLCPTSRRGVFAAADVPRGHIIAVVNPEEYVSETPAPNILPRTTSQAEDRVRETCSALSPDQLIQWKIDNAPPVKADVYDKQEADALKVCRSHMVFLMHQLSKCPDTSALLAALAKEYPDIVELCRKDMHTVKQKIMEESVSLEEWAGPFRKFYDIMQKGSLISKRLRSKFESMMKSSAVVDELVLLREIYSRILLFAEVPAKKDRCATIVAFTEPTLSKVNHSCCANASFMVLANQTIVVAADDIKKGDEISFNYLNQIPDFCAYPDMYHNLGFLQRVNLLATITNLTCACPLCAWQRSVKNGVRDSDPVLLKYHTKTDIMGSVLPALVASMKRTKAFGDTYPGIFTTTPSGAASFTPDRSPKTGQAWALALDKLKLLTDPSRRLDNYVDLVTLFTIYDQLKATMYENPDLPAERFVWCMQFCNELQTKAALAVADITRDLTAGKIHTSTTPMHLKALRSSFIRVIDEAAVLFCAIYRGFCDARNATYEAFEKSKNITPTQLEFWQTVEPAVLHYLTNHAVCWMQNTPWVTNTPASEAYKFVSCITRPGTFETLMQTAELIKKSEATLMQDAGKRQ